MVSIEMESPDSSSFGSSDQDCSGIANESSDFDEIQSGSSTLPPKRKTRYSCIFRKYLSKTFPWAVESKHGQSWAFCMHCHRDISMGQGGVKDLKRNGMTALPSQAEKATVGVMPLSYYFGRVRRETTIEAEIKFAYFLREHHLALSLTDHATKLFTSMFPDSAIAKEFKCGRTN